MAATAAQKNIPSAAPAPKGAAPAAKPAKPAAPAAKAAPAAHAAAKPAAAPAKPTAPQAPAMPATDAIAADGKLMDEVRIGFEELRKLNHDELRSVIAKRVNLLENVLKDREERRAAIETAKMAGKLLDIRHERAVRIHKSVNTGSYWAAAATMVLVFAVMI